MSRMRRGKSWGSCVRWIKFWGRWLGGIRWGAVAIGGWDRLSAGRQRNCSMIDVRFSTTFRTITSVIAISQWKPASRHPCSVTVNRHHSPTPRPWSAFPVRHRYPHARTAFRTHRRSFRLWQNVVNQSSSSSRLLNLLVTNDCSNSCNYFKHYRSCRKVWSIRWWGIYKRIG